MVTEFRNEPLTDFSKEENAQAMRAAIQKVREQLGREHPLVIGGGRIPPRALLPRFYPAQPPQLVGRFNKTTKKRPHQTIQEAPQHLSSTPHNPVFGRPSSPF